VLPPTRRYPPRRGHRPSHRCRRRRTLMAEATPTRAHTHHPSANHAHELARMRVAAVQFVPGP
jgi:phosphoribosyl 1,2-cyclic phosphodiesterase